MALLARVRRCRAEDLVGSSPVTDTVVRVVAADGVEPRRGGVSDDPTRSGVAPREGEGGGSHCGRRVEQEDAEADPR
jgi:hypothetical protein